jgi:hypothetical protein
MQRSIVASHNNATQQLANSVKNSQLTDWRTVKHELLCCPATSSNQLTPNIYSLWLVTTAGTLQQLQSLRLVVKPAGKKSKNVACLTGPHVCSPWAGIIHRIVVSARVSASDMSLALMRGHDKCPLWVSLRHQTSMTITERRNETESSRRLYRGNIPKQNYFSNLIISYILFSYRNKLFPKWQCAYTQICPRLYRNILWR